VGHYIGLRFSAKLKPDFIHVVRDFYRFAKKDGRTAWREVSLLYPSHLFLSAWAQQDRAHLLPLGADMPDGWEWESSLLDNRWRVCCGMKNKDTIDYFLQNVLPHMVQESVHVEIRGETFVEPR
jgi:hypothetical protein